MPPLGRSILWLIVVVLVAAACAGPSGSASVPTSVVPVTDLKTVAGTWAGVATRDAGDSEDWLELTLREDGTFAGFSARQIGAFAGQGKLQLRDGTVHASGTNGTAVMTLTEQGGPVLDIRFTERNGVSYSARLRPKT
jgi:hypothetical protein